MYVLSCLPPVAMATKLPSSMAFVLMHWLAIWKYNLGQTTSIISYIGKLLLDAAPWQWEENSFQPCSYSCSGVFDTWATIAPGLILKLEQNPNLLNKSCQWFMGTDLWNMKQHILDSLWYKVLCQKESEFGEMSGYDDMPDGIIYIAYISAECHRNYCLRLVLFSVHSPIEHGLVPSWHHQFSP